MILNVSYKLTVGGWSVNSADDARTELVALEAHTAMNTPVGGCRVVVYAPPPPEPGLLEAAAGATAEALGFGGNGSASEGPPVKVRGQDIKYDDPVSIDLSAGDASGTVMTAQVRAFRSSLGLTTLTGRTALQTLAQTRLNQVYENQSMKQIVEDLAGQAGVTPGEIDTGATYPYLVVHEAKTVLRHVLDLADRDSLDLYVDTDGKLTLKKFTKTSADHTFHFGIDVLDLHMHYHAPPTELVRVYGESPSSQQGSETWHWLAKDLAPFQSEVGEGGRVLAVQDGALRTKDAADQRATALYGAIQDGAAAGRLKLLGHPTLQLGDAIEIKQAPYPALDGLFKVVAVRHVFTKQDGYLTYVGFTGQGGADAAGGLLGSLGGLAGGLGL